MPEKLPKLPELPIDVPQAQLLLGYEIMPAQGASQVCDERSEICKVALQAQETMRDTKVRAATMLGLDISTAEAAAWKPNEQEIAALRSGLRRERVRARMLDGYESYIEDQRMTANALGTPLWPHQQDMLISTREFLLGSPRTYPNGGKGGYISAPPGVGKTGAISSISAALKYNENPRERVRILVLENTITVMHQTHGKGGDRGFGKFAPHIDVGLRYTDTKDLEHDVVIMPAASFGILVERGEMPDFDVVMLDEVDVYASGKTGEQLRKYCADKITIGFSASVDAPTRSLLPHEIYNMDLPTGIQNRLLAPTTAEVLRVEPKIDESLLPEDPVARKEMISAIHLRARMEDAKKRILQDVAGGFQVVVRCPAGGDIEVAREFAKELNGERFATKNDGSWPEQFKTMLSKVRAMEIGGSAQATGKGRRLKQAAIAMYDDGDIHVFTYTKALQRGWDSKPKRFYDLDPAGSWKEKLQGFGRVTRLEYDEAGNPIEARIFSYYHPGYPNQYTGVIALGGQPGQDSVRVGHQAPIVVPRQERRTLMVDKDVLADLSATTLEVKTVSHDDTVRLTFEAALGRLGVSSIFLGRVYDEHDFPRDSTVTLEDLETMLYLTHPSFRIDTLPEQGFVSDEEVLRRSGLRAITPAQLRLRARARGFSYRKYLDEASGTAGYYFATEEVGSLIEALRKDAR